jgi:hypothetical protein
MIHIGDKFEINTVCRENGIFKHTYCLTVEIFHDGDKFSPCPDEHCPKREADWILLDKLP